MAVEHSLRDLTSSQCEEGPELLQLILQGREGERHASGSGGRVGTWSCELESAAGGWADGLDRARTVTPRPHWDRKMR